MSGLTKIKRRDGGSKAIKFGLMRFGREINKTSPPILLRNVFNKKEKNRSEVLSPQQKETLAIKAETEAMQRSMAEQLSGKRRARSRAGVGLLSSESLSMAGKNSETLG